MAIPKEPSLAIADDQNGKGCYLRFKAVTQGKKTDESVEYQNWNCSIWIPLNLKEEWVENITPGNVFYVEYGTVEALQIADYKYPIINVKLTQSRIRKLQSPLWFKK